jgi:hypothetical protein
MSLEPGSAAPKRRDELDILRGVLLVLMAVTHLPTRLSLYSSQPFGFVSAAEGFVFLSAFLVGSTYSRKLAEHGSDYVRTRLWKRAGKLYVAHLALLLFAFTVVAAIAVVSGRPALRNHLSVYFDSPMWAAIGGPLLLYQPPLLDILPMYIVFLVLTPLLLQLASRRGWWPVLTVSGLLWLFAQLDGRRLVYGKLAALAGLSVPIDAFGAFDWFAWQLVWVAGVWFGSRKVRRCAEPARRSHRLPLLLSAAAATAVLFFVWRYHGGFEIDAVGNSSMFDKWHLGPLRVLNFAALAYLVSHVVLPTLGGLRLRVLSMLGRASLAVFTAHVPFVVLSRGLIIDDTTPLTAIQEAVVLAVTFGAMLLVAWRAGARPVRAQAQAAA